MDRRTRERLIGAVVLVALAVIALPPLLDGEGVTELPSSVPEPPPPIEVPLPDEREAAEVRARAEASARLEADGRFGWAVQVGSFARRENALALRARLRAEGHPAFVEPYAGEGGVRAWRVRVGPEPTRAEAEALRARLARALGLEGIVVAHEPGRGLEGEGEPTNRAVDPGAGAR